MIIQGNSYRIGLRDESIHCCVTSFPYHGLRDYCLPPTIWGGDSLCAHVWLAWNSVEADSLPLKMGTSLGIDQRGQTFTRGYVKVDANPALLGVRTNLKSALVKEVKKPIGKGAATSREVSAPGIINASIPVKDSPNEVPNKSIGDEGKADSQRLSGSDTELHQDSSQFGTPDSQPVSNIPDSGPVLFNGRIGSNEVSDELNATPIQANKAHLPFIADIPVGDYQSQKIGEVGSPFGESIEGHSISQSSGTGTPFSITQLSTEGQWGDTSMPTRTADDNAAAGTGDINAGIPALGGASPADANPGGSDVEGLSTGVTNKGNGHTVIICKKCQAVKCCFGLEPTIHLHVRNAVLVCREIWRVLRSDGILYLNYGDSYATGKNGRSAADTKAVGKDDRTFRDKPFSVTELPAKNLCGIPWRVALALQDDGWVLRSEIPWLKSNAMPSSVTDRPGTAHEHVFMLVKSARYYFDMEAVRRPHTKHTLKQAETDQRRGPEGFFKPGTKGWHTMPNPNPAGRALRTSDPFFDSLDAYIAHLQDVRNNGGMLVDQEGLPAALVVNTESYSQAHYATFPRKLIAPLIKTTPEKVCPNCGAAWVRTSAVKRDDREFGREQDLRQSSGASHRTINGTVPSFKPPQIITLGWQPTCKCGLSESECIGAVICDPFAGSGTVGQVCRELGRRFIGIDLSAKYLQENALPRAEKLTSSKSLAQLPMFADDHLQAAIEIVTDYLIEKLNLREDEAA